MLRDELTAFDERFGEGGIIEKFIKTLSFNVACFCDKQL